MPARLTERRIIDALDQHRGIVATAATSLGMPRASLYRRIGRSARLQAAVADAREVMIDVAESALYESVVNREPWAVQFYLRTQGKRRGYVDTQTVRHIVETEAKRLGSELGLDPDEIISTAEAIANGRG